MHYDSGWTANSLSPSPFSHSRHGRGARFNRNYHLGRRRGRYNLLVIRECSLSQVMLKLLLLLVVLLCYRVEVSKHSAEVSFVMMFFFESVPGWVTSMCLTRWSFR